MDRYNDNVSPDPSAMLNVNMSNNCYKTPDISSHYNLHSNNTSSNNGHLSSMVYPTPPSDNDESSSTSQCSYASEVRNQNEFTPTLMHNHHIHQSQHQYSVNQHAINLLVSNEIILDEDHVFTSTKSKSSTQPMHLHKTESTGVNVTNSSRYRRRSRTTYSKSQVKISLIC